MRDGAVHTLFGHGAADSYVHEERALSQPVTKNNRVHMCGQTVTCLAHALDPMPDWPDQESIYVVAGC